MGPCILDMFMSRRSTPADSAGKVRHALFDVFEDAGIEVVPPMVFSQNTAFSLAGSTFNLAGRLTGTECLASLVTAVPANGVSQTAPVQSHRICV